MSGRVRGCSVGAVFKLNFLFIGHYDKIAETQDAGQNLCYSVEIFYIKCNKLKASSSSQEAGIVTIVDQKIDWEYLFCGQKYLTQ